MSDKYELQRLTETHRYISPLCAAICRLAPAGMCTSVLFVCLGNICRSTMAEGVFRDSIDQCGLNDVVTRVDSCGTAAYHVGDPPDRRTLATLERHGIILEHRGRQLTLEDFDRFDYILAMDRQNLREIEKRRPKGSRATVALFGDFRQDLRFDRVIADPYYGQDASGFNTAFEQCKDFAAGLIDSIRGKE